MPGSLPYIGSLPCLDPTKLAKDLIRCVSVTPQDGGAMDLVTRHLTSMGFSCHRLRFGDIENLYARIGKTGPNLCFAGHTDVVPIGDEAAWTHAPFAGDLVEGTLWGRGAVDMKGAIAAFLAATQQAIAASEVTGSLSFLITGDEEGDAQNGTRAMVEWLIEQGESIDHCLVGEPTSAKQLGDTLKIGRRGSLNATITVEGVQGHVAYPHLAANPIPVLVRLLAELEAKPLDDGYPGFQASNLEITDITVGNPSGNVIPAKACARLNIRFNPNHQGSDLVKYIADVCSKAEDGFSGHIRCEARISGEAFVTNPCAFIDLCCDVVKDCLEVQPKLSTSGGTSDARFLRKICSVLELGLVGETMHAVNERVLVADVQNLTRVYREIIKRYFTTMPLSFKSLKP